MFGRVCQEADVLTLPHFVILEVISYLDSRDIIRARSTARAFRFDLLPLVTSLSVTVGEGFPSVHNMELYQSIAKVHLEGMHDVVREMMKVMAKSSGLRQVSVMGSKHGCSKACFGGGCALTILGRPLTELRWRNVCIDIPENVSILAWQTLYTLILVNAKIDDMALVNLMRSIPEKTRLPLQHLDLSFNRIVDGILSLSDVLREGAFPGLKSLELSGNTISDQGAMQLTTSLCRGACPNLRSLGMLVTLDGNETINFLSAEITRSGHGLQKLNRFVIGDRGLWGKRPYVELVGALSSGGMPRLQHFHALGDISTTEAGSLLRNLISGACPKLEVVKVEHTEFALTGNPGLPEEVVRGMYDLVNSNAVPHLQQLHVIGMHLADGALEKDPEILSNPCTSLGRLISFASRKGVRIFI
ncbi:unnamed protein product [Choristocarpus tenellus]